MAAEPSPEAKAADPSSIVAELKVLRSALQNVSTLIDKYMLHHATASDPAPLLGHRGHDGLAAVTSVLGESGLRSWKSSPAAESVRSSVVHVEARQGTKAQTRHDQILQGCVETAAHADVGPGTSEPGFASRRIGRHKRSANATLTAQELRIGIGTLISANDQDACAGSGQGRPYGCGLLPWCNSARRLQSALSTHFASVQILAVHASRVREAPPDQRAPGSARESAVRYVRAGPRLQSCRFSAETERLDLADCPGVRIVTPSARMLNASWRHAERVIASGRMSYYPKYIVRGYVFLWKWEYWRLGRTLDAILHADVDVDVLPVPQLAPRIALQWSHQLAALVDLARRSDASSLRMLGHSDSSTPWNGGVFWAFPPSDGGLMYKEGLDVLEAPWDPDLGWERAGAPRDLFNASSARYADGSRRHLSHKLKSPSWTNIDSGDLDQGFFLYMHMHRRRGGAYKRGNASVGGVAHYVRHTLKPWMRALNYSPFAAHNACTPENLIRQAYIRTAGLDQPHVGSACAVAFRAAAVELDAHLNRTACCAAMIEHRLAGTLDPYVLSHRAYPNKKLFSNGYGIEAVALY